LLWASSHTQVLVAKDSTGVVKHTLSAEVNEHLLWSK